MAVRELKDTVPVETLPADAVLIGGPAETASTPVLYSADAVAAFVATHPDVVAAIATALASAVADLVGDAGAALDTLGELANAIGDDADFVGTMTTVLAGKVPNVRLVSTGNGLSGGGDLSADRTLAADIASQAEAEAGTSTTKMMTPQRVAQAIAALGGGGGMSLVAAVSFVGTGTVTIRSSHNVSSITDLGTGHYRINFTTALADDNYVAVFGAKDAGSAALYLAAMTGGTYSTTGLEVQVFTYAGGAADPAIANIAIFR